jgi:hypothetical protein
MPETNTDSPFPPLQPLYPDGTPIFYNGNPATIAGIKHEVFNFWKRKHLFQPLLKHGAVALANGKLAVPTYDAALFIIGELTDGVVDYGSSIAKRCPSSPARLAKLNVMRSASGRTPIAPTTTAPTDFSENFKLAPHTCEEEDSRLLQSLSYVFIEADGGDVMVERADGSGEKLVELIDELEADAKPRDRALVSTVFAKLQQGDLGGPLTLESKSSFLKAYKAARRNLPESQRPGDEVECEMMVTMALKDPDIRELFEIKAEATPPTDLESASKLIETILRGRVRSEQIDALASGAPVLKVSDAPNRQPAPAPEQKPAVDPRIAQILAVLDGDPKKAAAGLQALQQQIEGKDKVKVPRDKDNKVLRWVKGMAPCKHCKGNHLHRDCKEDPPPAMDLGPPQRGAERPPHPQTHLGLQGEERRHRQGSPLRAGLNSRRRIGEHGWAGSCRARAHRRWGSAEPPPLVRACVRLPQPPHQGCRRRGHDA